MGKYGKLASDIIQNIGGQNNVTDVKHCVTRLRFQLKDESKAKDDVLKNMDGVVTVMHSAGQYQVVIGNHVPEVYADVTAQLDLTENGQADQQKEKKSFKDWFIDLLTSIFMPSLSVLCACGMIKGLNAILQFAGVYTDTSGIYTLVNAIGDSFFYFFPIVIGYNAAKKFKMNPYLGMIIGAALCYPAITDVDLVIFGINMNVNYTATVLPVILTVAVAAPMERWLNKVIPDVVKTFFTPMIVLLISTILGYMVIGPVANQASGILSNALLSVYNASPLIAGLLVGGLWQVMVVFGVHMTMIVLAIINISSGVPDPLLSLTVFAAFAQSAVVFAMWLKTKNKKLKDVAFPAFVSGIFGVTEPAIYGVTLPRMKMFLISCIGSAIAGAYAGFVGLKYQTMAGLGIFEIPAMFPADGDIGTVAVQCVIASVIAIVVSFIPAFILYKDEETTEPLKETGEKAVKKEVIYSPIAGEVKALSNVEDDAFAQEVLGKGVAIVPKEGKVHAPFDGVVMSMFPTKHAIGLVSENGCEVLIHIGMNTVQLDGKYFKAHVDQGDKVKRGQLLISFDLEKIQAENYCVDTPVIVTNSGDYMDIVEMASEKVTNAEELLVALQ